MIFTMIYYSPLGELLLMAKEDALIGLEFQTQKNHLKFPKEEMKDSENNLVLRNTKKWLDDYFAGKAPDTKLKLEPSGTPFQLEVWKTLCTIPYGRTITYKQVANEVAHRMGKEKMSAQAVGGAVGHNPIPIIIPCHRVIGTNGKLVGFSAGIDKKIELLKLEKVEMISWRIK